MLKFCLNIVKYHRLAKAYREYALANLIPQHQVILIIWFKLLSITFSINQNLSVKFNSFSFPYSLFGVSWGSGLGKAWSGIVSTVSWDEVSLSTPVKFVDFVFSDLWVWATWFTGLSKWWSSMVGAVSWDKVSLLSPVIEVGLVLSFFWYGSSWWVRLLGHVQFWVSLNEVAVLESALNKVEEVSNELSLVCLIDTLEERGIHLSLEVFIHIDLEVWLQEGLFLELELVHVSVHAHGLDFGHHLLLLRELVSWGGSQ